MQKQSPKIVSIFVSALLCFAVFWWGKGRAPQESSPPLAAGGASSSSGRAISEAEREAKTISEEEIPGGREAWVRYLGAIPREFGADTLRPLFTNDDSRRTSLPEPFAEIVSVTMRHLHSDGTRTLGFTFEKFPGAVAFLQQETDGSIEGHLIWDEAGTGLKITSGEAPAILLTESLALNQMLCTRVESGRLVGGLEMAPQESAVSGSSAGSGGGAIPLLQSLPGAPRVIYLDFDGETVSGSSWNVHYHSGAPIVAAPFTNPAAIPAIWEAVAEDFRPFQVNVTTDRAVFNAASSRNRSMAIFTPSNGWYGNVGGVAYTGSFGSSTNFMCWVFNASANAAAESASHETGHQLGLHHDGTSTVAYYSGHTHANGISWAPIMGLSYGRSITQFSKGEYANASEKQDDLSVISKALPFRGDDHGNTHASATLPPSLGSGSIDLTGIIERESDLDVVRIPISTRGGLAFQVVPSSPYSNVDLQLALKDGAGNSLAVSAPPGSFTASFAVTNLAPGNYFLHVSGSGLGNGANGYTRYGSVGGYRLTGTFPPSGSPGTPSGFSASDGTRRDRVELAWTPAPHAAEYRVYRSRVGLGSSYSLVATVAASSYHDADLPTDTLHRYYVTSRNALGESPASAVDTGFRQDFPAIPSGVVATDAKFSSHTNVKWSTATRATGYRVFRGTSTSHADAAEIATVDGATSFDDRTGIAGETYHYFVVALNAAGASPPSSPDAGSRTPALATPVGTVASQGSVAGAVRVTFGGIANASHYAVFRGLSPDPRMASFIGHATGMEFYDKKAAVGATYYYFVRAEGEAGDSAPSNPVVGTAGAHGGGDDRYEPNNRPSEAMPLDSIESLWLSRLGGKAVARDGDWYSFVPRHASKRVEALLRQDGVNMLVDMTLYDAGGSALSVGVAHGANQVLVLENPIPGEAYFLLVEPTTSIPVGYNLLWRSGSGGTFHRSDLSVGKTLGSRIGEFVYETRARKQKVTNRLAGTRSVRSFSTVVNEGATTAPVTARGSARGRSIEFIVIERGSEGTRNATAAMRRGNVSKLGALDSTTFQIQAKLKKRKSPRARASLFNMVTSVGSSISRDSGTFIYAFRKRR